MSVFVLTLAVSANSNAAPSGAKACIAAHEEGQTLRNKKKPHAAREKFVVCARAECPVVLRKECADQLALVEKDAPTVALEARDDEGNDATALTVTLDGAPIADKLTGIAIDVEPGEHVFRFDRADGKSIEQRVLVVEGEKNRKVVADFSTLVPKQAQHESLDHDRKPLPPPEKKISPLVFVAGGLAVAAGASFGFFALHGKSTEHDLQSSCSPHCADSDVQPIKRDYLVADISLGVGIVALAAAIVLVVAAPSEPVVQTASVPWLPKPRVVVR
ncbi:MAG TPA: hypothetical protein VIF62_16315 [Labilithrix sp.]